MGDYRRVTIVIFSVLKNGAGGLGEYYTRDVQGIRNRNRTENDTDEIRVTKGNSGFMKGRGGGVA